MLTVAPKARSKAGWVIFFMWLRFKQVIYGEDLIFEKIKNIESIQKTSLKVILGDNYNSYEAAMEMCGLESLSQRRENRCLKFGIWCSRNTNAIFPCNPTTDTHNIRKRKFYKVNSSRREIYKKSANPYIQRKLNDHMAKMDKLSKARKKARGVRI